MRALSESLASLIPEGVLNWVKELVLGAPRPVPVPIPVRTNRPHGQRRPRR
jgi:hypothetical protein